MEERQPLLILGEDVAAEGGEVLDHLGRAVISRQVHAGVRDVCFGEFVDT